MSKEYQIDNLDKNILNELRENARAPYAELGKKLSVSPATVHVRVEKKRQAGIIARTKVELNEKRLGYDVCCFIGINLKAAGDYKPTIDKLDQIEESKSKWSRYRYLLAFHGPIDSKKEGISAEGGHHSCHPEEGARPLHRRF